MSLFSGYVQTETVLPRNTVSFQKLSQCRKISDSDDSTNGWSDEFCDGILMCVSTHNTRQDYFTSFASYFLPAHRHNSSDPRSKIAGSLGKLKGVNLPSQPKTCFLGDIPEA